MPLADHHKRAQFCCGVNDLDRYIHERAGQDARRFVAAVCVLPAESGRAIIGYYTLSAATVEISGLPPEIVRRLPRYPAVPATLIGRLAVDQNYRGRGLGGFLLMDALRKSLANTEAVGSVAVVVDALDRSASNFYAQYGFQALAGKPRRLFLPMKTIARIF